MSVFSNSKAYLQPQFIQNNLCLIVGDEGTKLKSEISTNTTMYLVKSKRLTELKPFFHPTLKL
jgi:hypothetical protein